MTSSRLPPPAADGLGDAAYDVVHHPRGLDGAGEREHLGVEVVAHPRHGGELHAVGLLVEADPEAEVGRVDAELALDVDDVGGHQQQPAGVGGGAPVGAVVGRPWKGSNWPSTLVPRKPSMQADLGAGDPRADGQRQALGRALLLRQPGHQRARGCGRSRRRWPAPSRAGRRRGRARCCRAATRPVKSRTRPVERLASSRSSVTAAAASAGVTSGPSPATLAPRFTAKSQSTIDVMGRP